MPKKFISVIKYVLKIEQFEYLNYELIRKTFIEIL